MFILALVQIWTSKPCSFSRPQPNKWCWVIHSFINSVIHPFTHLAETRNAWSSLKDFLVTPASNESTLNVFLFTYLSKRFFEGNKFNCKFKLAVKLKLLYHKGIFSPPDFFTESPFGTELIVVSAHPKPGRHSAAFSWEID